METVLDNRPSVEFIVVADKAEAINGKLYMMGGGWDRLWLATMPGEHHFSVGVSVIIPWMATNSEHRLQILITDETETEVASAQVLFNAGTSAIMKRGEIQKVLAAFNLGVTFPKIGTYTVRAMVDDERELGRETLFYVNHRPAPR